MQRDWRLVFAFGLIAAQATAQDPPPPKEALIARAKPLELETAYVPPPGDPLSHHASGYAKVMCSAVFITGLDPDFAAENVGYFVAPPEQRPKLGKPVVDRTAREVRVTLPKRGREDRPLLRRPGLREPARRRNGFCASRPRRSRNASSTRKRRGRWATRLRASRSPPASARQS